MVQRRRLPAVRSEALDRMSVIGRSRCNVDDIHEKSWAKPEK